MTFVQVEAACDNKGWQVFYNNVYSRWYIAFTCTNVGLYCTLSIYVYIYMNMIESAEVHKNE